MYIPRTNTEVDGCPAGRATCSSTNTDPTPSGSYDTTPGMHRFIGIGMVIVMAFMVLIGWLYFANYPRRKFPFLYRRGRQSKGTGASDPEDMGVDDRTQSTIVVADGSSGKLKGLISIGSLKQQDSRRAMGDDDDDDKTKCNLSVDAATVASAPRKPRRSPPGKQHRKQGQRQGREREREDKRPTREERARALEKTRNRMLQAEPRGMVKQVSGGVVMYTKAPRTPAPAVMRQTRDRLLHHQQQPVAADWQFEHMHGVRFEARSPPHLQTDKPPSSTNPRPETK